MAAPAPSHVVTADRTWRVALGVTLAAVLFGFSGTLRELVTLWSSSVDYSHGFLIPPFMAYLLYTRRDLFPATIRWPDPAGVGPLLAAALLAVAAERIYKGREFLLGVALVLALAGVVMLFFGSRGGLKWAWPALVFPVFAFQLPFRVEQTLSNKLQGFATAAGNFVFQTMGLASYAEGNVIVIGDTRLGVEAACGGLSMLLTFVTLTLAIVVLYRTRPLIDRLILLAAAIPIALACNVVRITVTGLVYHAGWTDFGDLVVHDLAGWLMMPLALVMLVMLLRLIDCVTVPVDRLSTGEAMGLPARVAPR